MFADSFVSEEAYVPDPLHALLALARRDVPTTPSGRSEGATSALQQNPGGHEDTQQRIKGGALAARSKLDVLKRELGPGALQQTTRMHSPIRNWHSTAPVQGYYGRDFVTSYTRGFNPEAKDGSMLGMQEELGASKKHRPQEYLAECPPKQRWTSLLGTTSYSSDGGGKVTCLSPSARTTGSAFVGVLGTPHSRPVILGKVHALPEHTPPHHGLPRALGGGPMHRSEDGTRIGLGSTMKSEDGAWREERTGWRSLSAPKREGKDYPTGLHTPRSRHTPSLQGRYMLSGPDAHMTLRSGVELHGNYGKWPAQKPAKLDGSTETRVHTGAVSHRGWL